MMSIRKAVATVTLAVTQVVVFAFPAMAMAEPEAKAPDKLMELLRELLGLVKYIGGTAAVAGLLMIGIRAGVAKKRGHGGGEMGEELGYWAIAAVIIGSAASITGFFLGW